MSVSSISGSTSSNQDWYSIRRNTNQDFQSLISSLQQGNLAGAQQAYASLQQILPTPAAGNSGDSTSNASSQDNTSNTILNDWNALGQALQSGSTSNAQTALATLQQDALTAAQDRAQARQDASSVYAALQSANAGTAGSQSGGNVQNDLNSLNQALQSGDTTSAQKVLAQLEKDLQQSSLPVQGGHHHHHHHGGGSGGQQTSSANDINNLFTGTTPANASTLSTQA